RRPQPAPAIRRLAPEQPGGRGDEDEAQILEGRDGGGLAGRGARVASRSAVSISAIRRCSSSMRRSSSSLVCADAFGDASSPAPQRPAATIAPMPRIRPMRLLPNLPIPARDSGRA
ncbi:hypothetical protein, partial [Falsiroseomonas oryziterrae]|uniref:hypothetical protein n=1 Tax=Falsiroseomonas oryziterrae TaxID=2911368 RepID=UPI001F19A594